MSDAMNLSGSVDVPGIGKMPKGTIAVIGAGAAGIVAWAWWNRSRSAEAEEPSEGEYYADLRTGSAGSNGGYENPGGIDMADDDDDGERAPRNNQEWSARVLEKLDWYERAYVSRIISAYLSRLEVTQEEADVIREAWAQVGRPPDGDIPIRIKGEPATPVPPVVKPPIPRPPVVKPAAATPAPGSARGYGWYRVVSGDSAASIAKKYGMTLATFYAFNGPGRISAGNFVKVRLHSNPVAGPYYGR